MELNTGILDDVPRPAATVVMLRDNPQLEVFLLKRHGLSDVLGGAYVFPGGKVDGEDALLEQAHVDMHPADMHAALGEAALQESQASALYVAAMREAFEETGVLYAQHADAARAGQAWALLREGRAFDEVLALLGLQLEATRIVPWSRWITPRTGGVVRKRFDTRFFVAEVPRDQQAAHDNVEATESAWMPPREALRQYWEGGIELAPPQIMSLVHLSRHTLAQSVMAEARLRKPPLIQPEAFEHDGARLVCYPGDVRHPVRERALPGPTRLRFANKRFEPVDGFDALFS